MLQFLQFRLPPQQEEDWSAAMMINQENVEQAALWPDWGIITPDDPKEQSEPEFLKKGVYYYECSEAHFQYCQLFR